MKATPSGERYLQSCFFTNNCNTIGLISPAAHPQHCLVVSHIGVGITVGIVPITMPPLPAADDLLILEFIASNRRIPHAVFNSFIASQSPPSAFSRTSQRLRKALVLRALDAALYTVGASCSSSLLLHKARKVLADPDAAACFPHQIPFTENEENDEARAAVADLKRLLDLEWANLPPSTLELVAGDGSHQTGAAADHTMRTKLRLFGTSIHKASLVHILFGFVFAFETIVLFTFSNVVAY